MSPNKALKKFAKLALSLVLGACGGKSTATVNLPLVRDSAGIRIVETLPTEVDTTGWRLSQTPILDLGSSEDSLPLFIYPSSAARLSDGRIVVSPATQGQILLYDGAGHFLHTIGRKGRGPGEFESAVQTVRMAGDTLLVPSRGLLQSFLPDGRFVRSVQIQGLPMRTASSSVLGMTGTNAMVLQADLHPEGNPLDPHHYAYYILAPDGRITSQIIELPFNSTQKLFGGISAAAAIHDTTLYYTDGGAFEIRAYNLNGRLVRISRIRQDLHRMTDAEMDSYRDTIRRVRREEDSLRGRPARRYRLPSNRDLSVPLPAFYNLIVDSEGNLWAREYRKTLNESAPWWIFDRTGKCVARVQMPGRLFVKQIDSDRVLAAIWPQHTTDGRVDGRVVLYRIQRAAHSHSSSPGLQ